MPPGTLNVYYILVIHTDDAQVIFVLIAPSQPWWHWDQFVHNYQKSDNTLL